MRTLRVLLFMIAAACSFSLPQANGQTTFLADFDNGYDAVFYCGDGTARLAQDTSDADIHPAEGRFGKGVFIGRKVPARLLSYLNKGSLYAKEGTVEFWFKPEWDSTFTEPDGPAWLQGRTEAVLFTTSSLPNGFNIAKSQYNMLTFFYSLNYNSSNSTVGRPGNFWRKNNWDFYAVSWDNNEARLFLNGKLLAVSDRWEVAGWLSERFVLGSPGDGPHRRDGAWGTFDDLRISDKKMYISSFSVPDKPLSVQKENPGFKLLSIGDKERKGLLERKTTFLADFNRELPVICTAGSSLGQMNRQLPLKTEMLNTVRCLRLERRQDSPGDTLCFETAGNIDPFCGKVDVSICLRDEKALPVNVLDLTEIVNDPKRLVRSDLRTGVRLVVNKACCLEWQYLEAGRIIEMLSSKPLSLERNKWYIPGVVWRGSKVSLYLDGQQLAAKEGAAMPSLLPRYFYIGSNSQGEDTLQGWIGSINVTSGD